MLDAALLRAGRLERHLYVHPPSADERYEILKVYTNDISHFFSKDVDLQAVTTSMRFFVCADIEAFVQQLKITALDAFDALGTFDTENIPGVQDSKPSIQITRQHIDSVLSNMRGTLENPMIEQYEQGCWRLLYSAAEQDLLFYAAKLVREFDTYMVKCASDGYDKGQLQRFSDLREQLREEVFWRGKDFTVIRGLIAQAEEILRQVPSKPSL
jgi:hypothetical protein